MNSATTGAPGGVPQLGMREERGRAEQQPHPALVRQETALLLRHWWPATAVAMVVSTNARRAVATAVLVDVAVVNREVDDLPRRDLRAHVAARWLDGLAYGAGLWRGALRDRSARALLPRWVVRRRG
jgi:hypothetical protein